MLNDYRVKEYIKCPHCGEDALLDPEILTSYPPQRRYHCSHCGASGSEFCHKLDIFIKDDELDIIDDNIDKVVESDPIVGPSSDYSIDDYAGAILDWPNIESNVRVYSRCEICDEAFDAGPACSCGVSLIYHICPNCRSKLKYLLDNFDNIADVLEYTKDIVEKGKEEKMFDFIE